MKQLLPLLLLCSLLMVGCKDKNQPDDPHSFRVVGKMFIHEGSTPKHPYVADILYFFSTDSVASYSTDDKNYSIENSSRTIDYYKYRLSYPKLEFISGWRGDDITELKFKDMNTLSWSAVERVYHIVKE